MGNERRSRCARDDLSEQLAAALGSHAAAEVYPNPNQGDQNDQDEHEGRTKFNRGHKRKVTIAEATFANPETVTAVRQIHENERRNGGHNYGSKHDSKEKQTKQQHLTEKATSAGPSTRYNRCAVSNNARNTPSPRPLNPMSRTYPAREAVAWAIVGAGFAIFLLITQVAELGSASSLLQVGVNSRLAPYITGHLPDINLVPGVGTDGQTYFAIASDLNGDQVSELMNSPGLRFSRIGFPWLASLGGHLAGRALLNGMLTVVIGSAGLAATATMGLAAYYGLSRWVAIGLFGNLGWFLGIRLLTPDPLGIGLMLAGIWAGVHGRIKTANVFLIGAALTKEPYYAAALALAIWLWHSRQKAQALVTTILPALAILLGTAASNRKIGVFGDAPNIDWPMRGIIKASALWIDAPFKDRFYSGLAIVAIMLAIGAGAVSRSILLRWCAWGWAAIGLLGSDWIWHFGNSTARVLAPAFLFGILAIGSFFSNQSHQRPEPLDA